MVLSTMHTVSGSKVEICSTIEAQQSLGWADNINNMLFYVQLLSLACLSETTTERSLPYDVIAITCWRSSAKHSTIASVNTSWSLLHSHRNGQESVFTCFKNIYTSGAASVTSVTTDVIETDKNAWWCVRSASPLAS